MLDQCLQNEQTSPSKDRPGARAHAALSLLGLPDAPKQHGISGSGLQLLANCLTWGTLLNLLGLCVAICKMG